MSPPPTRTEQLSPTTAWLENTTVGYPGAGTTLPDDSEASFADATFASGNGRTIAVLGIRAADPLLFAATTNCSFEVGEEVQHGEGTVPVVEAASLYVQRARVFFVVEDAETVVTTRAYVAFPLYSAQDRVRLFGHAPTTIVEQLKVRPDVQWRWRLTEGCFADPEVVPREWGGVVTLQRPPRQKPSVLEDLDTLHGVVASAVGAGGLVGVSGATAGVHVSRSTFVVGLLSCLPQDVDFEFVEDPFQRSIGDGFVGRNAGVVVYNVLFNTLLAVGLAGLGRVLALVEGLPYAGALSLVRFPSIFAFLLSVQMSPTVQAAVILLAYGDSEHVVIACVVFLLCLVVIVAVTNHLLRHFGGTLVRWSGAQGPGTAFVDKADEPEPHRPTAGVISVASVFVGAQVHARQKVAGWKRWLFGSGKWRDASKLSARTRLQALQDQADDLRGHCLLRNLRPATIRRAAEIDRGLRESSSRRGDDETLSAGLLQAPEGPTIASWGGQPLGADGRVERSAGGPGEDEKGTGDRHSSNTHASSTGTPDPLAAVLRESLKPGAGDDAQNRSAKDLPPAVVMWLPSLPSGLGPGYCKRFKMYFDEFSDRIPWFFAVELVLMLAVGILDGLKLGSGKCAAVGIVFLCLMTLYLTTIVVFNPYLAPYDAIFGIVAAALEVTACVLFLLGWWLVRDDLIHASIHVVTAALYWLLLKVILDLLRQILKRSLYCWGRRRQANTAPSPGPKQDETKEPAKEPTPQEQVAEDELFPALHEEDVGPPTPSPPSSPLPEETPEPPPPLLRGPRPPRRRGPSRPYVDGLTMLMRATRGRSFASRAGLEVGEAENPSTSRTRPPSFAVAVPRPTATVGTPEASIQRRPIQPLPSSKEVDWL